MTATAVTQEKTGLGAIFSRFNKLFWVVNIFELFERGAFYTMMAIFTYHFIYNVNILDPIVGLALSVLMFLLYFVPIVASALVTKLGFKMIFLFSFIMIIVGYLTFWKTQNIGSLMLGVLALGVGAGCFKPMVSATIAHVTPERDRAFGYSIYYWMINLGAFIFPFVIGYYFESYLKDPTAYAWAFLISATLVVINIVVLLIFFHEPVKFDKNQKVTDAFKGLMVIFKDKKFIILLFIYSGFWFVYSFNLSFLAVYVVDFGLLPMGFAIMWISVINPLTIIIVGPALGKMVDKYGAKFSSVQLMTVGILLYVLGMSIMAFWKTPYAWIAGIVVFSFGEFITHPNFISYISMLAPKDKVAIYMGYGFIPIGIGDFIGAFVSGFMYLRFSVIMHRPTIFWAIVSCVGLLTVAGLLMYNRYYNYKPEPKDVQIEKGPDGRRAVPYKFRLGSVWNMRATPIIVLIFIPLLLVGASGVPPDHFYRSEPISVTTTVYTAVLENLDPITGNSNANSQNDVPLNISTENVFNVTITLSWTDEPPPGAGVGWTNLPDEFSLKVLAPDGSTAQDGPVANPQGASGHVTVTLIWDTMNQTGTTATGDYKVTVIMGNAGPNTLKRGPKVFTIADPGNDWTLDVFYKHLEKEVTTGGK